MSEVVFHFSRFTVKQDRCAMKVGTDGVLLGAWVDPGNARSVLDIGTGTGLIALMIAQRSSASVTAIDIDDSSTRQAAENVAGSPWPDQIKIVHSSLQHFSAPDKYDLIVSNPPYFINSYEASDTARNRARQADASLSYDELLDGVKRLLQQDGRFCVILPENESRIFRLKARENGLHCNRLTSVRTKKNKGIKRVLMEYSYVEQPSQKNEIILHSEGREFTEEYKRLTADFYPGTK